MTKTVRVEIPEFLKPGVKTVIGQHNFKQDEIIRFGKQFDPQRFHIDPKAAEESLLGGLCASGWHTTSVWMALQRKSVNEHTAQLKAAGKPYPEFGPSPGMSGLKWFRAVFVGNTITYVNTIREFRKSKSRPEWWVLRNFSEGKNQNGEKVIEFESTVFVKIHDPA
ncbi:MAG: MaoC family dehydratase [Rhizobiaceae bacterium]